MLVLLKELDIATDYLQFIMSSIVAACFLFSMGNKPSAYVGLTVLYHT